MAAMQSKADLIALLIGTLATALLVAITYFAQMAGVRAGQVQAFNEQLRREIAERVAGESKLRDSEAHYRELFEKAGDSISLISSDGKFIAVNPGFEAMTGFAAQDWIGKPFTAILHRKDLPRILRTFEKLLRSEAIASAEVRFLTQRGDYRIGEVNASTRYQHGQIAGVMAVVRDVTERKRAHEQIQLQLKRISALREINLAVTSTLDLRSVLSVLMQTIERLLPYSALLVWLKNHETGELQRAACWNLDEKEWMGRKLSGIPALVRAAMEERRPILVPQIQADPRTLDRDFYRRNGLISYLGVPLLTQHETLGVLVFLTREVHDFDDDEVGFLVSVASQTGVAIQNSQLYEKIHKQAEQLEEANKLQADFTAMIAHDLRSPLSNIIGIADMMRQGLFGPVCEEQHNWLDRMRNNGENLMGLVSDFLDVSKLESGRIELQHSSTDIFELARNIVVNYQPVATRKNIALTCAGDDALAPIQADARRLDQVITNLLSNALKFTGAGGAVEIRIVPEDDFGIRVAVQDSGIGIAAGETASLFHKYHQADSTRVFAHHGTGLGLVICKMIVEAHGGQIWVESTEGKGATFFFTLPDQAHAIKPATAPRPPAAETLRT
jgi:PAS domain S-box-containing protein